YPTAGRRRRGPAYGGPVGPPVAQRAAADGRSQHGLQALFQQALVGGKAAAAIGQLLVGPGVLIDKPAGAQFVHTEALNGAAAVWLQSARQFTGGAFQLSQ